MIQRVLIPFDGSAVAASVLPVVREIVRLIAAQVTFLQVLPPDAIGADERLARRELETVAEGFQQHEIPVQLIVARGQPAEQIIRLAHGHDLIAMATHGRSGLSRWAFGSVADRVARSATTPTLLVRATAEPPISAGPPRRVLVPLDGSALAEQALPLAAKLARAAGAPITLLSSVYWAMCVIGDEPGLIPPLRLKEAGLPDEHPETLLATLATQTAAEYLEQLRQRLPHDGVDAAAVVRTEPPAEAILTEAERDSALIVMTTRGRSGLNRWLYGSVAEKVLCGASSPVLLLRGPAPASGLDEPGSAERAVGDIMSAPVITVNEATTLNEVARLMLDRRVGCMPVVDEDGRVQGLITEATFIGSERLLPFSAMRLLILCGEPLPEGGVERACATARALTARQVMSQPVVTLAPSDPVSAAVEAMVRHDATHLPVTEDGIPVGVVARHDLLRLVVNDDPE